MTLFTNKNRKETLPFWMEEAKGWTSVTVMSCKKERWAEHSLCRSNKIIKIFLRQSCCKRACKACQFEFLTENGIKKTGCTPRFQLADINSIFVLVVICLCLDATFSLNFLAYFLRALASLVLKFFAFSTPISYFIYFNTSFHNTPYIPSPIIPSNTSKTS